VFDVSPSAAPLGLDETAHTFYLHHEPVQLQDHPNRLFIVMATIEKAFKAV
jgi:hypothetical protein